MKLAGERPEMRRICSSRARLLTLVLFLWLGVCCLSTPPAGAAFGETFRISTGPSVRDGGQVLRDVFDPCLGLHWQLQIDSHRPDGPRRMVLLHANPSVPLDGNAAMNGPAATAPTPLPLVIRAGDRIIVDQETATVHARLQATALESAVAGQRLRARLGGGRFPDPSAPVVSVVALGNGAARWAAAGGSGR